MDCTHFTITFVSAMGKITIPWLRIFKPQRLIDFAKSANMSRFGKVEIWLLPNLFVFYRDFIYRSNYYYTESFKCFYLTILPIGVRWPSMMYQIKPLRMTKSTRFLVRPLRLRFISIPVETTWTLPPYNIEPKGILKNQQIFTKTIMITQWRVSSKSVQWKYNIIYETRKFFKKCTSFYYYISNYEDYALRKITDWLGKIFWGFIKLNPVSDYGRIFGDAFTCYIIIPFQVFLETSLTFCEAICLTSFISSQRIFHLW